MLGRNHLISNAATLGIVGMLDAEVIHHAGDSAIMAASAELLGNANTWLWGGTEPGFGLYAIGCVILFVVAGLLPDMDSRTGILGRYLYIPVGHRTWLHALWIPIILLVASVALRPLAWVALGYICHLFWDNLSSCGVCWFYPVPGYKGYDSGAKVKEGHWAKLYHTGKTSENVVIGVLVGLLVITFLLCVHDGLFPMIASGSVG